MATGNIIEENHYYSYGLKIAAISSKKLGDTYEGTLKNNYLYQGAYSEMDDDIGWNDFALRNYDPQVGRWVQHDPYDLFFESQYVGMGNDPVNNIDPTGGIYIPPIGGMSQTAATAITLGEVIIQSVSHAAKVVSGISTVLTIATITSKVFTAANIINSVFNTQQVGDPFARGSLDAVVNAKTLGFTDFWGSTSNLSDYKSPVDQEAYLNGRLAGDAIALALSVAQIEGGGTTAATGLATGPGALVISSSGGAIALHGALSGAIASADATWATAKLLKLGLTVRTSRPVEDPLKRSQAPTNNISNDAEKIGGGHAWGKHRGEFPEIKTQTDFKNLVDKVKNSASSLFKKLSRGREAWYDKSTNTLVIKDPNSADLGTMFRPTPNGEQYFNGLK